VYINGPNDRTDPYAEDGEREKYLLLAPAAFTGGLTAISVNKESAKV